MPQQFCLVRVPTLPPRLPRLPHSQYLLLPEHLRSQYLKPPRRKNRYIQRHVRHAPRHFLVGSSYLLALSATGAAVTLLATPNTIAAALLTLGIALSILGLGIVWAGIRGKRSSWLSFVATLLAFPVATLIGLSFIIPTSLMNAPQEQFLPNHIEPDQLPSSITGNTSSKI